MLETIPSATFDELATKSTNPLRTLLALELGSIAGINRDDKLLALPLDDKIGATLRIDELVERRDIRSQTVHRF